MLQDSASHAVWYAASELQTFVFRITGAAIPIFTDRLPAGPHDIVLRLEPHTTISFRSQISGTSVGKAT